MPQLMKDGHKLVDPTTIAVETAPPQVRVGLEPASMGAPRPDLSGYRLQVPGQPAIYLVDPDGFARWVPDPTTYNNLFVNWSGIVADVDLPEVAKRPQITSGAILAKGDASAPVYLVDQGVKRWIVSPAVMTKYYFNWQRIVVMPQLAIDYIPNGANWT